MKLYKVLEPNMKSPFVRFQYELGKEYTCDDFDESDIECSKGFYATDVEGLTYSFNLGRRVFECEVSGKSKEFDIYKRRYEKIKLIRELHSDEIKILAKTHEEKCGYKLAEALFPFNPLKDGNPRHRVTKADIDNLIIFASVGDSVGDSVGASVWDSIRASVWESVRDSVGDSVGDSVWDSVGDSVRASVRYSVRYSIRDSVWAYVGSLFTNIKKWKYVDHVEGEYPFQCLVDLWYRGFVPSFDGRKWRLHQGKDAKIVYKIEKEEI